MFQQSQRPNDGSASGLYRVVSALGSVIAVGAAILLTPLVFQYTRGPLLAYLSGAWGEKTGDLLTWAFCGVEAFTIYFLVKLGFTACVVWCMAAFAAKRL